MMESDIITMAHGGGGSKSDQLIKEVIHPRLRNPVLDQMEDSACIDSPGERLAVSTDSYVVDPVFFPGGNIGDLAVSGTVNDLAMQGAEPLYLTLGLIIEEGFPVRDLERVLDSIRERLAGNDARIITGDTKVVESSGKSSMYINTAGIGVRRYPGDFSVRNACEGDAVIVTGSIGDHGLAVLSCREGLEFSSALESDSAPLWSMIEGILKEHHNEIHSLRDPTRGGLATLLSETAKESEKGIKIKERNIPVKKEVKGACSMLGLDPLESANEGKAVVICNKGAAGSILDILRTFPEGSDSTVIGEVVSEHRRQVVMETETGGLRRVETPSGTNLPRIC